MSSRAAEPAPLPDDLARACREAGARVGPCAGRVRFLAETRSTNDAAAALAAAGEPEGTTIVAGCQTAGRGRMGRTWFSPPGSGLYVSVVLRPEGGEPALGAGAVPLLSLVAGVALAEGVRNATGLPAELKWPNDLVVGSGLRPGGAPTYRKFGGILIEASGLGTGSSWAIVGFGLNLGAASWPSGLARTATSIEFELGRPVERAVVLVEALAGLARRYEDWRRGRAPAMLARWVDLSPTSRGAAVRWMDGCRARRGHTAGVDETGALLVNTDAGQARITAGEIEWT